MTVAAKKPTRQRRERRGPKSLPQPTDLLAWYDGHARALAWRLSLSRNRLLDGVSTSEYFTAIAHRT